MTEEDIPLCPCCDQPIFIWEEATVMSVGQAKCLVHADCFNEND